jgi:rhomboid family GlyGly-CTERM serine protease
MVAGSNKMTAIVLEAVRHSAPEECNWILPAPSWRGGSATATLTVMTLVIALWQGASEALQFDRAAIEAGEPWRHVTSHFTHWNNEHLAWDLLVFFGLGCVCEKLNRQRFLAAVVVASVLIPFGLWILADNLPTYRGLSGLDTALFALLSAATLRAAFHERNWALVVVVTGLLLGLAGKTAFELVSGGTIFVRATEFQPVPLAHLIGAGVGAFVGMLKWRR